MSKYSGIFVTGWVDRLREQFYPKMAESYGRNKLRQVALSEGKGLSPEDREVWSWLLDHADTVLRPTFIAQLKKKKLLDR